MKTNKSLFNIHKDQLQKNGQSKIVKIYPNTLTTITGQTRRAADLTNEEREHLAAHYARRGYVVVFMDDNNTNQ